MWAWKRAASLNCWRCWRCRMALLGEKLGHKVYLVVEKLSELELILEEARELDVTPRIGLRARLGRGGHH